MARLNFRVADWHSSDYLWHWFRFGFGLGLGLWGWWQFLEPRKGRFRQLVLLIPLGDDVVEGVFQGWIDPGIE